MEKGIRGFTVIEVTLVLAIAGLIFLMVFTVLPGLRASQKDTERKDAITNFLSQVRKYQINNRGALPGASDNSSNVVRATWSSSGGNETSWRGFYRDYLRQDFMDPDGANYILEVVKCNTNNAGVKCAGYDHNLDKLQDASFPNGYVMTVVLQATCNGSQAVASSNPRSLAVLYRLEGSGVYCGNS